MLLCPLLHIVVDTEMYSHTYSYTLLFVFMLFFTHFTVNTSQLHKLSHSLCLHLFAHAAMHIYKIKGWISIFLVWKSLYNCYK
uniref:Uncharacterized protein n=1 Tax=Rhizophora mucronata TaxID=61149 RepID=A0A2P2PMA0_RHIMU